MWSSFFEGVCPKYIAFPVKFLSQKFCLFHIKKYSSCSSGLKSGLYAAWANIVLSAYVYLVPHGMSGLQNEMGKPFGVCKIDTMQCHIHHTFEIATGIAVVIGLLMVFSLISTFLKKED